MPRRAPTQSQLRVLGLLYYHKSKSAKKLHASTNIISSLLEMGLIRRNNRYTFAITHRGKEVYERSDEMYKSRREPKKRINISISRDIRIQVDRAAAEMGVSRSVFLQLAALEELKRSEATSNPSPIPEGAAHEPQ